MSSTASGERRKWPDGYQPARTRRLLVDTALSLFETQGFDRTSLQQIVEGAGVTKGAFYHHFDSKEDLLFQIQEEYLDAQQAGAAKILAEHDGAEERLAALIRLSIRSVAEYHGHVAVFYQERRQLTGERLELVTKRRDEIESVFRDAISQGMKAGVFQPDYSAQLITFGIIGMCAWAFQWLDPAGRLSVDQVSEQLSGLVLHGLRV